MWHPRICSDYLPKASTTFSMSRSGGAEFSFPPWSHPGPWLPMTSTPLRACMWGCFGSVWLFATPWTTICQDPLSTGFSRQEYWSGLTFPSLMHESEKWKWSHSVVSDSLRPHGLQPTRLLHPWDFPGKSTGVGCHRLLWFDALGTGKLSWCRRLLRCGDWGPKSQVWQKGRGNLSLIHWLIQHSFGGAQLWTRHYSRHRGNRQNSLSSQGL